MDKKILVTTSTFPRWSQDSGSPFVQELCQELAERGWKVVVLAPFSKGAQQSEILDGIKIYRYRYLPASWEGLAYDGGILAKLRRNRLNYFKIPSFVIAQILAIRKIVRKENIGAIHAHWIIPQGLAAVLYKRLFHPEIRILCTAHGSDILGLTGALATSVKKFVLKNINILTVVSRHLESETKKILPDVSLAVLPMGVDLQQFSPQQACSEIREKWDVRSDLLLFVGRLAEEKGVRLLIDAMPQILAEFPKIKLLIIGAGELEGALRESIRSKQLENSISLVGFVAHAALPRYLSSADILVGPSLYEGLGLIFLEALACGCPVIASDLPSLSDIILDGKTGYKVQPGNRDELSQKIIQLLKNKSLLQAMKSESRSHILSTYDMIKTSQQYSDLLAQFLK